MRIWDIVDLVYPGVEITGTERNKAGRKKSWLSGIISSAAQSAFAVGLIMASTGSLSVKRSCHVSDSSARIHVPGVSAAVDDAQPIGQERPGTTGSEQRLLDESLRHLSGFTLVSDEPTDEDIGPVSKRFTE